MLEDIELKLLAGYPIETSVGLIYQPSIKNIIEMGEDKYNQFLGLLLFDTDLLDIPSDILKQIGIDRFTTFDFLFLQSVADSDFKKILIDAMSFFFKKNVGVLDNYHLFYVGNIEDQNFIDRDIYDYIKKILIKLNYLKDLEEEEELQFANDLARQWYLDIKKAEQNQPKPKPQVSLHSIISALYWRTNKSMNEMLDMTVYQLYDGYHRLFLIDDCLGIRQGIYHGTINGKEIKPAQLNWAKIIKFDEN